MKKFFFLLVAMFSSIFILTGCTDKNLERAIEDFNNASSAVEKNNTDIRNSISKLQKLIDSGDPSLDPTAVADAKSVIKEARGKIVRIPEIPDKTETIRSATERLMTFSNPKEILKKLDDSYETLSISINQMKLITNPEPQFIKDRLTELPEILTANIVTEDDDPEGLLNTEDGYTGAVYFTSSLVPEENSDDHNVETGGAIEIYPTVEKAEKRNEELATLDGSGMFSGASHSVLGTLVIRMSNKLSPSQLKKLNDSIYTALTTIN